MSQLSRSTFDTTYVNSAGTFADNSTREISEGDMRQFSDDISDSFVTKADDYDYWFKKTTASGTDTYTITDTVPAAYASDEKWLISFTNSNTGAATLNRNSLGAKNLKSATGGALSAGDIVAGGYYLVIYNGTEYRILNSVAASGGLSGLTSPRIPYATSATTLGDSANLSWDNTNNAIGLLATRIFSNSRTYDDIFWGEGAGNFTISGGSGGNVGLGYQVLDALTNGDDNVAIGRSAGGAITTGDGNIALGYNANALVNTGSMNIAIGYEALDAVTTGLRNIAIGQGAGGTSTGSQNIFIGYLADNAVNVSGSDNVYIGSGVRGETGNNKLNIQNIIFGNSNDTSTWDTTDYIAVGKIGVGVRTPARRFHINEYAASMSAVTNVLRVGVVRTTGTPLAGIGAGIEFAVDTAAGNNEIGALIEAVTTDVTSTSEDFDLVFKLMSGGSAAGERLRITSDGRLYGTALHNNSGAVTGTTNQYIASGTWTPTITNTTNVAASTPYVSYWTRVGNVVHFAGAINIDATSGSPTSTAFDMSLPIASNFVNLYDCSGQFSANVSSSNLIAAEIRANTTADTIRVAFYAPVTSAEDFYFIGMYLIK